MREHLEFNFHNIIGVEVHTQDIRLQNFYRYEFRRAAGKISTSLPKVTLTWDRRSLFESIPQGYTFHIHKLIARWTYRIFFEQNEIQIFAMGNKFAIPMVHHMLLQPAIRYLSCLHDVLMLHGSSVVREGKSIILTGRGGAGKTTSSSLLLQSGGATWQLHADDYIFVLPQKVTKGFLTRSHLYLDILKWIPKLTHTLTPWERMRLEFLGRLRAITRDGVKWPVRISEDRLWPNHSWAESADLGAVLMLRRGMVEELEISHAQVDDKLVDDLLEMNFYEARHFCKLVEKVGDTGLSEKWVPEWREKEHNLIKHMLLTTPTYWLDLPSHPDIERVGKELVDKVAQMINPSDNSK